jgi:hypothetical protein
MRVKRARGQEQTLPTRSPGLFKESVARFQRAGRVDVEKKQRLRLHIVRCGVELLDLPSRPSGSSANNANPWQSPSDSKLTNVPLLAT